MTHALTKDVGCFKVGTRTMEKVRCIFQLGRASCSSETICTASFLLISTAYAETLVLRGKTTSAKAAVGPICVLQAGRRMQVPSSQISKPLKRLLNNMILIQVRLHHRPQLNSSQKNLNSSSGDTDSQPERLLLQRRLEQNQFGSILRCSPCQEC